MDYAALAEEIAKPAYDGLTDAEAAEAANAVTVSVDRPVSSKALRRYLVLTDKWAEIERIARFGDADTDKVRAALRMVSALDGFDDFDLTNATYLGAISGQLETLVVAGLIDAAHKTAMLAMGSPVESWVVTFLGVPRVTESDIAFARSL
jgi:hypothetical protein